ncbi:MAG TPA: hypothetical protein DD434_09505, partial [Bacteroidales bacterium]|nr:hypothetical protein [Bacteroidales bacterium]
MKKYIKFKLIFLLFIVFSINTFGQKNYKNCKLIIYQADYYESVLTSTCQFNDYFIRVNCLAKIESINDYYLQLFDQLISKEDRKKLDSSYPYNIDYFQTNVIIDIIEDNRIYKSVSLDINGFLKMNNTIYFPDKELMNKLEEMIGFIRFKRIIELDNDPIFK